jgi:hypothetical protein
MMLATAVWLLAFLGLLIWMNFDSLPDPHEDSGKAGDVPSPPSRPFLRASGQDVVGRWMSEPEA